MNKYYVKIQVNYDGYLEANSEKEATDLAWDSYYGMDAPLQYESVESIEVEEVIPDCPECCEPTDKEELEQWGMCKECNQINSEDEDK